MDDEVQVGTSRRLRNFLNQCSYVSRYGHRNTDQKHKYIPYIGRIVVRHCQAYRFKVAELDISSILEEQSSACPWQSLTSVFRACHFKKFEPITLTFCLCVSRARQQQQQQQCAAASSNLILALHCTDASTDMIQQ
eukprot:3558043-Amphidinium_carterae.1